MSAVRLAPVLLALMITSAAEARPARCTVTEKQILGAWVMSGGEGFFEEFALELEGGKRVFNSWMHHRPDTLGASWSLNNCVLRILGPDRAHLAFAYRVKSVTRRSLILEDEEDHGRSRYRRID